MFFLTVLLAALGSAGCWDIFDAALEHSATARHPSYVTYDEHIAVDVDKQRLLYSTAHIDYRDDGTARVQDERFGFHPFVTRHAEPGPPELGPYGAERVSWIPEEPTLGSLPVIASVRTQAAVGCTVTGSEEYKGHSTYHLVFSGMRSDRPAVKEMWVDTESSEIWKLIVSGYVLFMGADERPPLTDFQVELGYAGPYLVVNHVVWAYRRPEYSQWTDYFGEYTLSGFAFPPSLPQEYFGGKNSR